MSVVSSQLIIAMIAMFLLQSFYCDDENDDGSFYFRLYIKIKYVTHSSPAIYNNIPLLFSFDNRMIFCNTCLQEHQQQGILIDFYYQQQQRTSLLSPPPQSPLFVRTTLQDSTFLELQVMAIDCAIGLLVKIRL